MGVSNLPSNKVTESVSLLDKYIYRERERWRGGREQIEKRK